MQAQTCKLWGEERKGAVTIRTMLLPLLHPPAERCLCEQVCPGCAEDPAMTAGRGLARTRSLLIYRTSLLTAALQMNPLKVDMK